MHCQHVLSTEADADTTTDTYTVTDTDTDTVTDINTVTDIVTLTIDTCQVLLLYWTALSMRISRIKYQTRDSFQVCARFYVCLCVCVWLCVSVRVCLLTVLRLSVWLRGVCLSVGGVESASTCLASITRRCLKKCKQISHTPDTHTRRCCLPRLGALNLSHLKYDDKQKENPTQNNPNKTKSNCIFIYKCFALQHSANALRILNVPPVWVCVCVNANVNDGVVFRNNTAKAKNARELRLLLLLHSGW